uniref:Nodal modulator 1 n=1 Tax=Angiostrongylus cantonensis TaxID=6313 RepID=A0A0K0DL83_ANGCA
MIPVYSKGQYSLKVFAPEGWYFEPEVVDFNLDGVNDPCTQNRDINFFLTGFSIHGVVDGVSGSGPTGLSLILKQDGKVIDSTTTTEGGKYLFKAVAGKYEVSTGIDSSVCIRHGKTFVEVTNAPVLVKPDLRIAGYTFTVAVRNKDQPLPNARITLYSKRHPELENCNAVISPVREMEGAKFICNVGVTKDDGIISVPCLPNGIYYVTAEYKTDEAGFIFSPAIQKLVVENEAVEVSFSVIEFTARGRVVVNRRGVSGAQVVVQGKEVTESDANGYFTLQGLTEGTLDVTARAPHTKFSNERIVFRLPNIKITDVNVESFEVCGSVEISSQDAIVSPLILKKIDGTEIVSIRPTADGKFCKMVAPGKYSISPADSSSTLTPRSLDIDVTTSYISDLRFTHFKTDAVVLVTCIGTCETLSISLLQGTNVLHTVRGKDEFVFKNIGPGAYRVRINEGDRACWEKRDLPLFIDKVHPQPVHFVQSGFTSIIKLSHPAHMVELFFQFFDHKYQVPTKPE